MANNAKSFISLTFLLSVALSSLLHALQGHVQPQIDSIYQFGDSISDTGNLIRDNFIGKHSNFANHPYGQDFFHKPTGRCCNGRLMIDFFAEYFKLPYIDAHLNTDGNFTHGVNFAVAGSPAQTCGALAIKGVISVLTCSSLSVQLGWFKSRLSSICPNPLDCKSKFANSLFIVESGGNDLNYALIEGNIEGKDIKGVFSMVPEVVGAIKDTVEEVIKIGATRIVVTGNLAFGCMPIYLYFFPRDKFKYDELNFVVELNELSKFQSNYIEQIVNELRVEHPEVTIVFADYYTAMKGVVQNATALGFEKTHRTCCGKGDNITNFGITGICGLFKGIPVCPDPDKSVSWDGIHMTERTYKIMANWLLHYNILPAISK